MASRLRTARNNLAVASDKYNSLLMGPSAKKLLDLIGNPTPIPHGAEVGAGLECVCCLHHHLQPNMAASTF